MSKRLRCCAIGATGNWFKSVHQPSLDRLVQAGRIELSAAASRSEEGRRQLTAEAGYARAYADAGEMLDTEKPDYAMLSMAVAPMTEMTLEVLKRRIPLLVEKPTGNSPAVARRVQAAAEEAGGPHLVAYNRRFNPLLLRVKQLVEERGGLSHVACEFLRNNVSAPRRLMGSALHSIDALRYLAGEITEHHGVASGARYFDEKMIAASFSLGFENGIAGSFTFNVRAGRSYERYRLFAENWTATVSLPSPGKYDSRWWLRVEEDNNTVELVEIENLPAEERNGAHIHGFWREHEYFVDCLESGREPSPGFADSVASMELAQKMLESVAPEQTETD